MVEEEKKKKIFRKIDKEDNLIEINKEDNTENITENFDYNKNKRNLIYRKIRNILDNNNDNLETQKK